MPEGTNRTNSLDPTAPTRADPKVNDYLRSVPLGLTVEEKNGDGLSVATTITGGVAQQSGIVLADQIMSINGRSLKSAADMSIAVQQAIASGKPATMTIKRGGELHTIHVDLSKPTANQPTPSQGAPLQKTSTSVTQPVSLPISGTVPVATPDSTRRR